MKISCIVTDFDFTLSHFSDPIDCGLFDVFRRRGVSEDLIKAAFDAVARRGYNKENFINEVFSSAGSDCNSDKQSAATEISAWLKRSLTPYPDSEPFLWKYWGHTRIVILTHGEQIYQRQKINAVAVPYDEIHVVTPPRRKADVLQELLGRFGAPLLFVDDRGDELDMAVDRLGAESVKTVWMGRDDAPAESKMPPKHTHIRAASFETVVDLI